LRTFDAISARVTEALDLGIEACFAIGDCSHGLYMQRDIPAAVIVPVAIVTVIRRRAANSVSQKWNGVGLSTRFGAEILK
jgi:hypothetical protein